MPNWCEGYLKIRGKRENVIKFLTEGVNVYGRVVYEPSEDGMTAKDEYAPIEKNYIKVDEDDSTITYELPDRAYGSVYVEGTRRGFIEPDPYIFITDMSNGPSLFPHPDTEKTDYKPDEVVAVVLYKQAWYIDIHELCAISKQYTIDFKIFAVERGMGFSHEIEIWNGEIREDRSNSYETYGMFLWKCPFPELGG